jgi:hypothetical protein
MLIKKIFFLAKSSVFLKQRVNFCFVCVFTRLVKTESVKGIKILMYIFNAKIENGAN